MKLSPEARAQALKTLAFTPEREGLISSLKPKIEEMVSHPNVRRAYVIGSMATNKPKPGDIDILTINKMINPKTGTYDIDYLDWADKFWGAKKDPLHVIPRERISSGLTREIMKEGQNRYGEEGIKPFSFLDKPWVRIAGLGTGLGLASSLVPDEQAEAFQVGKMKPVTKEIEKLATKPFSESSALEALKGKFVQGLEIINVLTKGKGDERFVILKKPETGETFQWPIDKEALSTLSAVKGYETYMDRFKSLGPDRLGKAEQAMRSMDVRMERGLSSPSVKEVKPWTESYLTKAYNLSPIGEPSLADVPDLVYVRWKGEAMHLPRWYADFLEHMKNKPANRYLESELADFRILKQEPKLYKSFAKGSDFDPYKTYQYGLIDAKGEMSFLEGTGEELSFWLSPTGLAKQKEEGIKILRLEDLQDYIEKLGGMA